MDAAGQAFVTGLAGAGFPTTTGPAYAGGTDAFVTELGGEVVPCGGEAHPCPAPIGEFVPGPETPRNPPPSPPAPPKPPAQPGAPSVGNYGPEATIDSRTSTFVYHCSGTVSPDPCEGSMGYTGSGSAAVHYLVLAHFKVAAGKSVSVRLRLPKRTLAQLHRLRHLTLTLVVTVHQGTQQTVRRETLKLKLGRRHRH